MAAISTKQRDQKGELPRSPQHATQRHTTSKRASVKTVEGQPTRTQESFCEIEIEPRNEWFVLSKTPSGRTVWYLRLKVTGMYSRLFGPFSSKDDALLCLDEILGLMLNEFSSEIEDVCRKRQVIDDGRDIPIIERPPLKLFRLK